MFTLILVGLAFGGLYMFFRPVRQITEAGIAQIKRGSLVIWRKDPIALYQSRIEDAIKMLAQDKGNLIESRALLTQLERQKETSDKKINECDRHIHWAVATDNEREAKRIAESLVREKQKNAQIGDMLKRQRENYELHAAKFKIIWDRIESEKDKASYLKSRLDLSSLEAQMNSIGVYGNPDSALGALDEITHEIELQIDKNSAVGIINADLGLDDQSVLERPIIEEEASLLLEQYRKPQLITQGNQ